VAEWTPLHLSGPVATMGLKRCRRRADFTPAYDCPQAYRTSHAVDQLLTYQDRLLSAMRYWHATTASARRAVRTMALQWNFHPSGARLRRDQPAQVSPFDDLNGFPYHPNWLHNLLIASSGERGWPLPGLSALVARRREQRVTGGCARTESRSVEAMAPTPTEAADRRGHRSLAALAACPSAPRPPAAAARSTAQHGNARPRHAAQGFPSARASGWGLTRNEPYRELGATYFDEKRREHTVDRLAQRIERLGYEVHLEMRPTTA
jgi:hypothetical protein